MRFSRETGVTLICSLAIGLAAAPLSAQVFAPLAFVADGDEERPAGDKGDYWIGVRCANVPPLLRAQLDLPEDQGVLVDEVVPDSPAQQAGLKAFDVVFSVNDKPVADPQALAGAVTRAEAHDVRIEYLRAGRKQSVTVKPAPRPESIAANGGFAERAKTPLQREDQRTLRDWVERLEQGPAPMRFRWFHPGMVLPPGASLGPALPDDVTVRIEKQGGKPAEVTVKRGDKEWQANEESLGKLPEDVRGFAQQMLGLSPFVPGELGWGWAAAPHAPGMPPRARPLERRDAEAQLRQRLDEMGRQLDDLRKAVDKLQQ